MLRCARIGVVGFALCAGIGTDAARAATMIIDLNDGGAAAIGIQYNGTVLSTAGPQNTPAEFLDFLDWYPDILAPTASFTLDGVTRSGPAAVFNGSLIVQQFAGGTFSLFDPTHALLLSGNLSNSGLTGTAGLADGGLFTTSFSMPIDGALAPYINPGTLVLQMHLSNINGGAGLDVGPTAPPNGGELSPFTANVTANINGEQIPEPTTATALLIMLCALPFARTTRLGRRKKVVLPRHDFVRLTLEIHSYCRVLGR